MIVDKFDVMGIPIAPDEAETPLIVNSDTMLPLSIPCQTVNETKANSATESLVLLATIDG